MGGKQSSDFAPPWRWGIFLRRECEGLAIERSHPAFEAMNAIYNALKTLGFRETYWQFVYPNQIGGLIKSVGGGRFEFHVRFFRDGRIYAEFEGGRSALLHFVVSRRYLNRYVAALIKKKLPKEHHEFFLEAVERYKLSTSRTWNEWGLGNRIMTPSVKRGTRYLSIASDWRILSAAMLASTAAYYVRDSLYLPLIALALIALFLIAPRRH